MFIIIYFLIFLFFTTCYSNEECVQVIGRLLCQKDQKRVINSEVQLWELDSPLNSNIGSGMNPIDPDDEVTFTKVNTEDGEFQLSGCGQDHDWLPGVINRPEFYLKVRHRCNNRGNNNILNINNNASFSDVYYKIAGEQETKIVLPVFRKPETSFTNGTQGNSTTFDWHLKHPIELSEDTIIVATTGPAIGFNGINYNLDENLEGD